MVEGVYSSAAAPLLVVVILTAAHPPSVPLRDAVRTWSRAWTGSVLMCGAGRETPVAVAENGKA
jgi:hypothetical protein